MWTLISSIDLKRTRSKVSRATVTALIVVATATDAALGLFAKSAQAAAVAGETGTTSALAIAAAPAAPAAAGLPAIASAAPMGLPL